VRIGPEEPSRQLNTTRTADIIHPEPPPMQQLLTLIQSQEPTHDQQKPPNIHPQTQET